MSLLEGDLANAIYTGFKGKLLSGRVIRKGAASSGGTDAHGDPIDVDDLEWDIEGFFDNFSRSVRGQAGIPDATVKVCIFAQSAPDYVPRKDDLVILGTVTPKWAQLAGGPQEKDPAGAMWTLDATPIPAPQVP